MMLFDQHTHNQNAPSGHAVICLPQEVVAVPDTFKPRCGVLYSAGVHPWWTDGDVETLWRGVETLASHPQVVALGETGFDRLRGDLSVQEELFTRHVRLAARLGKELIIHCVRAYDLLLSARARNSFQEDSPWLLHGFRGKPALASQLLDADIRLSFGPHFNPDTLALIPTTDILLETDDSGLTIDKVAELVGLAIS